MARLDSVLSFSHDPVPDRPTNDDQEESYDNGGSDDDDDDAGFEFAFAPPLAAKGREAALAPADDLFAHGRILPAYPVFQRRPSPLRGDQNELPQASTAPASPDTYCAWAPRSAPGSPARDLDFPKSASTGSGSSGEARRFWRLRDLVGGRSHSDGKEKFVFLQPGGNGARTAKQDSNKQKQSKKKNGNKATEMDMATAHRLFYGNQAGALPGADRKQHSSYLPYRTGIVGFFATAHALRRSHHPY